MMIHNDILISSIIDEEIFLNGTKIIKAILEKLELMEYDFSSLFILNNEEYDNRSILLCESHIDGSYEHLYVWLRLIDCLILRPNGCYILDQHISLMSIYDSFVPIIITFSTKNNNLMGIIYTFDQSSIVPIVNEAKHDNLCVKVFNKLCINPSKILKCEHKFVPNDDQYYIICDSKRLEFNTFILDIAKATKVITQQFIKSLEPIMVL